MFKRLGFLFLILSLVGCASTKSARYEKTKPDWIKTTPIHPEYYIGIAGVSKTVADYRNAAKRSALENMASEISVNISSQSVLQVLETNASFKQEYQQDIKVRSSEKLEGYEIVDSWESDTEYWVYYKLSKSYHAALKAEKKNLAKEKALAAFFSAQNGGNNFENKFALCIQALSSISDYFNEPIYTSIDGKEQDLAFAIVTFLRKEANRLQMNFPESNYTTIVGNTIPEVITTITVLTNDNQPVVALPLTFIYQGTYQKTIRVHTNKDGKAIYKSGKITDKKSNQSLSAQINFEELAKKVTFDRIILKFIGFIPNKSATVNFNISLPKIYIDANEKQYGQRVSPLLLSQIQQSFIDQGFEITTIKKEANLVVRYSCETSNIGLTRGLYQVVLNGKFEVFDKNGQLVYTDSIDQQKTVNANLTLAANEVSEKATRFVARRSITLFVNQFLGY